MQTRVSGSTAPRLLYLGTRWWWMLDLKARPLYCRESSHWVGG